MGPVRRLASLVRRPVGQYRSTSLLPGYRKTTLSGPPRRQAARFCYLEGLLRLPVWRLPGPALVGKLRPVFQAPEAVRTARGIGRCQCRVRLRCFPIQPAAVFQSAAPGHPQGTRHCRRLRGSQLDRCPGRLEAPQGRCRAERPGRLPRRVGAGECP